MGQIWKFLRNQALSENRHYKSSAAIRLAELIKITADETDNI